MANRTEPACWAWPPPPPLDEFSHLAEDDWRWPLVMAAWQKDRCAICGIRKTKLVWDHDHETGLIRGCLCSACNTSEGGSGVSLYVKYRERNPASIWGIRVLYDHPQPAAEPLPHDLAIKQIEFALKDAEAS